MRAAGRCWGAVPVGIDGPDVAWDARAPVVAGVVGGGGGAGGVVETEASWRIRRDLIELWWDGRFAKVKPVGGGCRNCVRRGEASWRTL